MISIDRAKKLAYQGDINMLIIEAENCIDRVIEYEAANKGKLDFLIFEKSNPKGYHKPKGYHFDYEFRTTIKTLEPIQIETYRKRIVKAYRDEGYNAEYKQEELDNGYDCYCFEIHGFIKKDK